MTWRFPLFGEKRRELEAELTQLKTLVREVPHYRMASMTARTEVQRLRTYISEQMEEHFRAYNGGLREQLKQFSCLQLPTPWVPFKLGASGEHTAVDEVSITGVTYVREERMIPVIQAGHI